MDAQLISNYVKYIKDVVENEIEKFDEGDDRSFYEMSSLTVLSSN